MIGILLSLPPVSSQSRHAKPARVLSPPNPQPCPQKIPATPRAIADRRLVIPNKPEPPAPQQSLPRDCMDAPHPPRKHPLQRPAHPILIQSNHAPPTLDTKPGMHCCVCNHRSPPQLQKSTFVRPQQDSWSKIASVVEAPTSQRVLFLVEKSINVMTITFILYSTQ